MQLAGEGEEVVSEGKVRGVNAIAMMAIEKGRELYWKRGRGKIASIIVVNNNYGGSLLLGKLANTEIKYLFVSTQ